MLSQLEKTDEGRTFLLDAKRHSDALLAFDHRTPSVSPLINGFDLQRVRSSSVTSILGKAPILDAGVAMVPGPASQSRVSNNAELARLRRRRKEIPSYYAIQSNFEPEDIGWRFWKLVRKTQVADPATDAIFDDSNDLVVDTRSMIEFSDEQFPQERIHAFQPRDKVHHVNYFQQAQTVFIRENLSIP
jgi:hypothetical protein